MKINTRNSARINNISKVKYHLPNRNLHERKNSITQLHSNNHTRKHSIKAHDQSNNHVLVVPHKFTIVIHIIDNEPFPF